MANVLSVQEGDGGEPRTKVRAARAQVNDKRVPACGRGKTRHGCCFSDGLLRLSTSVKGAATMAKEFVAYGLYPNRESFESAVEALRAAEFRNSDISAVLPERDRTTRDLAHEINTKTPEGIAAGAGAGAAIGGVLGWLVGIGALAIPGIGPLVAAGPIVAALAGAGAAGATGGLVGGLIGAGIPEVEAKRYAGRIREGGYLLSVHCDDKEWASRAEAILERTGGRDVVKAGEADPDYRP
jgi:hypothetical protein